MAVLSCFSAHLSPFLSACPPPTLLHSNRFIALCFARTQVCRVSTLFSLTVQCTAEAEAETNKQRDKQTTVENTKRGDLREEENMKCAWRQNWSCLLNKGLGIEAAVVAGTAHQTAGTKAVQLVEILEGVGPRAEERRLALAQQSGAVGSHDGLDRREGEEERIGNRQGDVVRHEAKKADLLRLQFLGGRAQGNLEDLVQKAQCDDVDAFLQQRRDQPDKEASKTAFGVDGPGSSGDIQKSTITTHPLRNGTRADHEEGVAGEHSKGIAHHVKCDLLGKLGPGVVANDGAIALLRPQPREWSQCLDGLLIDTGNGESLKETSIPADEQTPEAALAMEKLPEGQDGGTAEPILTQKVLGCHLRDGLKANLDENLRNHQRAHADGTNGLHGVVIRFDGCNICFLGSRLRVS
eukprot:m.223524 g.223524  ORF g.223524 m.223524 type:complete len:409 (-) comp16268_c0_seq1:32-1258(-)